MNSGFYRAFTAFKLLLVWQILLAIPSACLAQTSNKQTGDPFITMDQRKILRELDTEIILNCLELGRFNIDFHQEANKHWAWRSVLYPLAKETGTAMSFANVVSDLGQRGRSFNRPDRRSNAVRRRGLYTTATGKVIAGTGSALELTQNGLVCLIARKKRILSKQIIAICS